MNRAISIDDRLRSHIPPLRPDEFNQLEENILREGCKSPLVVWNGVLVDGHNRYAICTKHDIPFSVEEVEFPDFEAAVVWIEENQLGRRNLTADQFAYLIGRKYDRAKRQGARVDLTSDQNDQKSGETTADRVAAEHGISGPTVRRAADFAENVDAIAEQLGDAARTEVLSGQLGLTRADVAEAADALTGADGQAFHFRSAKDVFDWVKVQKANKAAAHNHLAQGTGENEWYTPPEILSIAREVLGGFDLDPASSDVAQRMVQAERYFSAEDDALTKEWKGKVWLNPPYSRDLISRFCDKLLAEISDGRVSEAIVLTHNYTDTAWFHTLGARADRICLTRGRIRFVSPDGETASPTQGQAFFYFGSRANAFEDAFDRLGLVT